MEEYFELKIYLRHLIEKYPRSLIDSWIQNKNYKLLDEYLVNLNFIYYSLVKLKNDDVVLNELIKEVVSTYDLALSYKSVSKKYKKVIEE